MKNYLLGLFALLFLSPVHDFKGKLNFEGESKILPDTLQIFCQELLGRPTANSITINACANKSLNVYYEYGLDSTNYTNQTTAITTLDSIPFNVKLSGLTANTKYYYRMRYRLAGGSTYLARYSHFFHTQRPVGSTFKFAIEADPHLDTNSNPMVYAVTLRNILAAAPDFLIDLGDTFMSEKLVTQNPVTIRDRHLLLRSYFDSACHSVPLFLVLGNHEGELGWLYDSTNASSLPVWAANFRMKYFQNPVPDTTFYTGNTVSEPLVGLRQNYYSFQWGNVLIIVLDPYWYTKSKPGWGWTLGSTQYNWFKNLVTTSTAKFKFVFCHQLVGGNGTDGRGGTEFAHLFENGGRNADSTWGFDTYRTGWGGKPIHQLMVENRVNAYFHGHDHFFGFQTKDNVIYQEVPQPSLKNYTSNPAAGWGYVNGVLLPNRGYLLMSVSPKNVRVDYVRTYLPSEENSTRHNGDISYSYTIDSSGTITNVSDLSTQPEKYSLNQNYPNPFNPETNIKYSIPKGNNVQLKVYDIMGREVISLVNEYQQAGTYTVSFNADKLSLSSGIYFYKIQTGEFTKSMKMILLK